MAATATASKTASRTEAARRATARAAPARRATPGRASRTSGRATPTPGRLVPLAVGRTAGAIGGLADSGLVIRLTRGRLWIGALAVLLVGIVALNVVALSFTASSSDTARKAEELSRQGSALRAQLAKELSNDRVQSVAAGLGLIVPEPGSIRYLRPSDGDAAEAARRLRSGELAVAPAPVTTVADPAVPQGAVPIAPAEPQAPAPEVPAEPGIEAPVPAVEPQAVEPAAPPPGGASGGGGVSGGGVASP